jgi:hypothetical protein
MRYPLLLAPLLLFACDKPATTPQPRQRSGPIATQPREQPEPVPEQRAAAGDAASSLARYYGLIEQGDYDGAWEMRGGEPRIDRDRFAANFKAYESYRAQVGTPSLPVRAGDWDYVEVPVMITGRLRGGRAFANGGSVTLRRAHSGPDRAWRIYG